MTEPPRTVLDVLAEYEQAWRDGRENYKQHQLHRGFIVHHAADLIAVARAATDLSDMDCHRRGRRTVCVGTRQGISPTKIQEIAAAAAPLLADAPEGKA